MKTIILCLILIQLSAHAQQLDPHQQKGLSDTKRMLTTPSERNEAIKNNKQAKEVDAKVGAFAGSQENKEDIYAISAEVMEKLTQEAGGDPEKMQAILLEAQKNPKAFYQKYFPASAKAQTSNVANKLENSKISVSPNK